MMDKFSIKDLERLSGVKAHTIRIWEQRYNLLKPSRTDTNIRYYTGEDLKHILNVSLLNNHGLKISKIAELDSDEIVKEISRITDTIHDKDEQMNQLVLSLIELDEEKFEKTIDNSIKLSGFKETVVHLVYPFLERIGIMWQIGTINPAQEHFISYLIRQKFIVAINDQKNKTKPNGKKIILYLPEGELHEISLLFHNYLLREQGHRTYYLGQSIPQEDLVKVMGYLIPDYVVSVITNSFNEEEELEDYVENIRTQFLNTKFIYGGYQISESKLKEKPNLLLPLNGEKMVELLSEI